MERELEGNAGERPKPLPRYFVPLDCPGEDSCRMVGNDGKHVHHTDKKLAGRHAYPEGLCFNLGKAIAGFVRDHRPFYHDLAKDGPWPLPLPPPLPPDPKERRTKKPRATYD